MDSHYLQHVRSKLEKRLKRLNAATQKIFRAALIQTWGFLQSDIIIKCILDDLETRVPQAKAWANIIIANGGEPAGKTELENAAITYWVVKRCATTPLRQSAEETGNAQLHLIETWSSHLEEFRLERIAPFFDYIEERIDDKRMTLVLLRKYKQRCEWFRRKSLLGEWKKETRQGESFLASDLYEYLHDQGIQLQIEPQSASGRVDLISAQTGEDPLLADVKLFNPKRGQDCWYLIKGFRQVYDYTRDYNAPFGYLVVFKTCAEDLSISTRSQDSAVPLVTYNNKTIFFVVIDIFNYPKPASKRGKLKAHEITSGQIVESLRAAERP